MVNKINKEKLGHPPPFKIRMLIYNFAKYVYFTSPAKRIVLTNFGFLQEMLMLRALRSSGAAI